MKKSILTVISSLLILLGSILPARAQGSDELRAFQDAAGDRSILFRGQQAAHYIFPANGHPYWSKPEFERGDITFEGNLYRNVPINVDAHAQRALVRFEESLFAVALTPELTSSFTMGDRRFIGLGPGQALPEGFYEIFGEGPELVYKNVYKRLDSSVINVNGSVIGYEDPNYRSDVTRHFAYVTTYYFRDADGNFSRFKSLRTLIRKFPNRKQEIRKAVRTARSQMTNTDFDVLCKTVLNIAAQ